MDPRKTNARQDAQTTVAPVWDSRKYLGKGSIAKKLKVLKDAIKTDYGKKNKNNEKLQEKQIATKNKAM